MQETINANRPRVWLFPLIFICYRIHPSLMGIDLAFLYLFGQEAD